MSAFHTYDAINVDQDVELLVELQGVTTQEAIDETKQCRGAYVLLIWLRYIYRCALFANKSSTHISVVFLDAFRDPNQRGGFSWGAAELIHMYENLNYASLNKAKYLSWISEHFPSIENMIANEDYHKSKPRVCRWKCGKVLPVTTYHKRLDKLTTNAVCWIPYDTYQRGYYDSLTMFSPFLHSLGIICALGYMEWFYMISHPFMSPPQVGEPPKHPPMVHNPIVVMPHPIVLPDDITTMPHPPATTPIDVEMPRNAVVVCQNIAERLQHMLDMTMMTAGTDAYTITDQYIRLARCVTEHKNAYV
ncbi:Protein MAIN-LIKE 2 [Glycine soja]